MTDPTLPFVSRLTLSLKILFDGRFARRVDQLDPATPALPAADPEPDAPTPRDTDAALQLLALMQREGRLVDFLQQDVADFPDADIGAAARVVHTGCRKVLSNHLEIHPIRAEDEGARITLESGFDAAAVKLTGNVGGTAPYSGALQHRGWRAASITLPEPAPGHDATVLAPAEVEL